MKKVVITLLMILAYTGITSASCTSNYTFYDCQGIVVPEFIPDQQIDGNTIQKDLKAYVDDHKLRLNDLNGDGILDIHDQDDNGEFEYVWTGKISINNPDQNNLNHIRIKIYYEENGVEHFCNIDIFLSQECPNIPTMGEWGEVSLGLLLLIFVVTHIKESDPQVLLDG